MLYSSLLASPDKLSYSCQNLWFNCSAEHILVFALLYSAKVKTIISWFTPTLPYRQTTGKNPTDSWYWGHDVSITLLETWQGVKEVAAGEPVTGCALRRRHREMLWSTTPINLQSSVQQASSKCWLWGATTPDSSAVVTDIVSPLRMHVTPVCWAGEELPGWGTGVRAQLLPRMFCRYNFQKHLPAQWWGKIEAAAGCFEKVIPWTTCPQP